jgi:hypothetical protein
VAFLANGRVERRCAEGEPASFDAGPEAALVEGAIVVDHSRRASRGRSSVVNARLLAEEREAAVHSGRPSAVGNGEIVLDSDALVPTPPSGPSAYSKTAIR